MSIGDKLFERVVRMTELGEALREMVPALTPTEAAHLAGLMLTPRLRVEAAGVLAAIAHPAAAKALAVVLPGPFAAPASAGY